MKRRRLRRERRRRPQCRLDFTTAAVRGQVTDWSPGGLAVQTRSGLRVGGRYDLRVGLRDRTLGLRGTVRWCRLTATRRLPSGDVVPVYRAGLAVSGHAHELAEAG